MLLKLLFPAATFFVLAALCSVVSGLFYQNVIEEDLTNKVEAVLTAQGLPNTGIRFTGHQLTSAHLNPIVAEELDNIIGAYIPPLALPSHETPSWISVAEGPDETIEIKGLVPDRNIQVAIINAARRASPPQGPSRKITSHLEISSRAQPLKYQDRLISLIPRLLRQADTASISTHHGKIIIHGMINNQSQIEPLLRGLPAKSALIVQPLQPLDFKITRSADKIILSGVLPSGAVRASLRQLVESATDQPPVSDETTIALRPAQSWWSSHPEQLLPAFLDHSSGPAELHFLARQIHAKATFLRKGDLSSMNRFINDLPLSIVRQINLHLLPPPAPEPLAIEITPEPQLTTDSTPKVELLPAPEPGSLDEGLQRLPIFFNKSSTYLKPSEWTKVEQAAKLILSSEKPTILLSGFSSHRGDPQTNQSLARLRAKEVRKRLIKLGVPSKLLETRAQPADEDANDPSEGRRVEISILTT